MNEKYGQFLTASAVDINKEIEHLVETTKVPRWEAFAILMMVKMENLNDSVLEVKDSVVHN